MPPDPCSSWLAACSPFLSSPCTTITSASVLAMPIDDVDVDYIVVRVVVVASPGEPALAEGTSRLIPLQPHLQAARVEGVAAGGDDADSGLRVREEEI